MSCTHQHTRALTHHEAVPALVPGPGGLSRILVALAERTAGDKAHEAKRDDAGLRATSHYDISLSSEREGERKGWVGEREGGKSGEEERSRDAQQDHPKNTCSKQASVCPVGNKAHFATGVVIQPERVIVLLQQLFYIRPAPAGTVPSDVVSSCSEAEVRSGAGCGDGVVGAHEAKLHGQQGRAHVCDGIGDEERRNLLGAFGQPCHCAIVEHLESADARANKDTDTLLVNLENKVAHKLQTRD